MELTRIERGESFKNREILFEPRGFINELVPSVINARFARKKCQRSANFFSALHSALPIWESEAWHGLVKSPRGELRARTRGTKSPRKRPAAVSKLQRTFLSNPVQVISVRARRLSRLPGLARGPNARERFAPLA